LLVAPANASAPAAHAGKTSSTHYAMQASGYSTRVTGGGVPVSSGRTAFQVIGCTNKAGLSKQNSQADLNLSQLLNGTDISTATTHVWTRQKNGVVSSYANNHIAQVTIAGSALPTDDIVLTGINSRSRTWHDSKGFHASTKATLAGITVGGNTVPVPINGSVDLGLVTLTLGNSQKSHNRQGASAQLDALKLAVNLTNTKVYLAHSRSTIHAGVKSGLFHGSAYAAKAQALAGTVTVGRTPYIVMPCQGTNGKLVTRHVANVNPGLVVKGLSALQKSDQTGKSAYGHESGRVARVSLSKGTKALRIRGVVGKANVYYSRANGIRKDTKGSGIVSIRLNGKRLHLNAKGNLKIGNLVSLKSHIVKSTKRTIQITELRITLLGNGPNAGATVDLGYAKVGFSKSF
jgi:hypothetical protein